MSTVEKVAAPSEHQRLRVGFDYSAALLPHLADLTVVALTVTPYGVIIQVENGTQARVLSRRLGSGWSESGGSDPGYTRLDAPDRLGAPEWASWDRPTVTITALSRSDDR